MTPDEYRSLAKEHREMADRMQPGEQRDAQLRIARRLEEAANLFSPDQAKERGRSTRT